MTQFVTLPVAAGFGVAAVAAFKYEDQLIKIKNLTGLTAEQTKKFGDAILEMGGETGKTPLQLAEAFYFLASSGFKGQEAMDALEVSAKASAAGLGDVMATADVVSSAINAYGHENLDAAHMVDVLMKTIEVGKAEPEQLAASLGRIMPIAQGLKVPIEDLGGMIAGLTLTGLSSAESVTALRGAMMALSAPTKMSIEAYKEMGLTYKEVSDRIAKRGLIETLQFLYERVDGDRLALRKLIPNVRALNGVLSLLGPNYQKNLEVIDKVNHAQGKLNETFADTKATNVQKIREAWAKLQAEAIKVGAILLPYIVDLMEWLTRLAERFSNLSDGWKMFLLRAAATAAVIGPIVMVLGTLVNSLGLLRGVLSGLNIASSLGIISGAGAAAQAAGVGTLASKFGALVAVLGPLKVGLAGIAIGAAAAYGAYKLSNWLDGTTDRINKMRKAAEAVAEDKSLQKWADENLGGHLVDAGGGRFTFIKPEDLDKNADLLANWVKTEGAKAKAAAREADQQMLIDLVAGQKSWVDQEIRNIENRMQNIGGARNVGPQNDAIRQRFEAQIAALRASLPGIDRLMKEQQERMDRVKLKNQVIVFEAQEADVKDKIAEVKKKLADLKDKPHTVKMMLREERLKERLADLRAGLGDLTGQSYTIKLNLRIQNLEDKLELAKKRLAELKGGGGEHPMYTPEVTADITKLQEWVGKAEKRVANMKEKAEGTVPVLDLDPAPAFTALGRINDELDALANRVTETSVVVVTTHSDADDIPKPHSGGLFSGPHSGYPAVLHGTELVLPLDHPNLIPALLRRAGLTAEGLRAPRVDAVRRAVPAMVRQAAPAAVAAGGGEIHYHSHVAVPQGVIVDDTERFARRLSPWQEREMRTAQRRRQRGRAGL